MRALTATLKCMVSLAYFVTPKKEKKNKNKNNNNNNNNNNKQSL